MEKFNKGHKRLSGWMQLERDTEWIPWTGCRIYYGSVDRGGYGRFTPVTGNGRKRVHRWVYEQTYGPIPDDLFVCHKCDVPSCCNPEHLFLGTVQDNHADMWQKGRGCVPTSLHRFGEENPVHKLTETEVLEIYAKAHSGTKTLHELADEYNVCFQNISLIKNKRTWKHLL